jgi:hypothetical protein
LRERETLLAGWLIWLIISSEQALWLVLILVSVIEIQPLLFFACGQETDVHYFFTASYYVVCGWRWQHRFYWSVLYGWLSSRARNCRLI